VQALRAKREAAGLTQRQLADLIGVTDQTISNIERGATSATLDTARALARELACSVEDLFVAVEPTETVGAAPTGMPPGGAVGAATAHKGSESST